MALSETAWRTPDFIQPHIPPEHVVPVRLDLILSERQRNERMRILFGNPKAEPARSNRPPLAPKSNVAAALARGGIYGFVIYHDRGDGMGVKELFTGTRLLKMLHTADSQASAMHAERHPEGYKGHQGYQYDGHGSVHDEFLLSEAAAAVTAIGEICDLRRYADDSSAVIAIARNPRVPRTATELATNAFIQLKDW